MRYILIFSLLLLISCGDNMETNTENNPPVNTEMGLLNKLISFPKQPESLKWQVHETEGDAANLVALLVYSPDDVSVILANSPALTAKGVTRFPQAFFEEWVPAKITASMNKQINEAVVTLPDVHAYAPDVFTQTDLSPFVNGTLYDLGDGYLLLDLSAM